SVTVTAKDALNNTVTGYTRTVRFTSSDPQAVLPADYTFVAADNGAHVFSVVLKAGGSQSVTATDLGTPSVNGSATITVSGPTAGPLPIGATRVRPMTKSRYPVDSARFM